ncbi:MAG TPA: aldolase [Acidimicrobiales bacterium]|nr:aldolase [Acidimicrobiales bacterium]
MPDRTPRPRALGPDNLNELTRTRIRRPGRIAELAASRTRPRSWVGSDGKLFLVAADHPARAMIGVAGRHRALADRGDLLGRLLLCLDHPAVDGVMASPDIVEDLLLLGALESKVVVGSMNRGGLQGAVWELDDRFTGADPAHLASLGYEGGKMLLRIDPRDPGTVSTLEACARAVTELADRGLMAMVEPLPYTTDESGAAVLDPDPRALERVIAVASALGATSSHTWLKLPAPEDPAVLDGTTLPVLLLGGDPGAEAGAMYRRWERAFERPGVVGLVAGRSLLYPPDDEVWAALDRAAVSMGRSGVTELSMETQQEVRSS